MDDQSSSPTPPENQPARGRRTHGVLGLVTVTAMVTGAACIGVGFVAGRAEAGPDQSGSASSPRSAGYGATSGSGQSGGTEAIPGNPGWRWSDGGGTEQAPSDPFEGLPDQGGLGSPGQQSAPDADASKATSSQLTGLVRIVSTMKYAGAKAAGTGMVLTSGGEVVTNHHVVEGSTSLRATVMSTGKTYVAKVVGTDAKDDVAVLRLTGASGLSTVKTDTGGAALGDAVTAVGDANGTVDSFSAAKGKVTGLSQSITTQSEGTAAGEKLTGLMKISSDVVSGDSGGATYDADGEVVGMTTAASTGGSEIDGYAVPIAKVLSIVDDLDNGVTSSRYDYGSSPFLGVALGSSTTQVAGVYRSTPAAAAGIAAGDRVTAIDGSSVTTSSQLRSAVAELSPGDRVSVSWTDAAGASHTKTLTLMAGPVA